MDNQLYQGFDYSPACPPEQVQANQQDYVYNYSTQSCQISDKHASSGTYGPMKTEKTSPSSVTSKYAGVLTPRRRPGRPRIKSLPTEEEKRLRLEKKSMYLNITTFICLKNNVFSCFSAKGYYVIQLSIGWNLVKIRTIIFLNGRL